MPENTLQTGLPRFYSMASPDTVSAPRVEISARPSAAPSWQDWRATGHVLVVDDDEAVRMVLTRTLARMGLTVSEAATGAEAVALFAAEPEKFSLVLLDYKLPGMDSRTVFGELRARKPGIRVILMSGYGQLEALGSSGGLDFAEFLHKPFTMAVLSAKLRAALGT
jgi:two-component system cell cycle sensor histidine kinase/response regulator CckA